MNAGPQTSIGSMIGAPDQATISGPAANATGALDNDSYGQQASAGQQASTGQASQNAGPTESSYGAAPDLTINGNPQNMSSTGYSNQGMSSTGYNNLVDLVGGQDAFNSAYGGGGIRPLPSPSIGIGAPTPLASATPTPKLGRAFDPLVDYANYGAGPEHKFYMAEGGLASFPTMAYTDGQASIAMPPGLTPYDTVGSDVMPVSPMSPTPAAAAPNLVSNGPLSAFQNQNAGQFPSQISQNPNLGYSLGQSPLSRLTGPNNG